MSNEIARIYVNDIEVGSLPSHVYRKIVTEAKRDKRLYFAQAMNFILVVLQLTASVFKYIPFTLILFLLLGFIAGPDILVELVRASRTASPEYVVGFIGRTLLSAACFNLTVLTAGMGFGSLRFGYVNHFDAAISRRVKSLLEVPADGDLSVIIQSHENGSLTAV